jgi:hypothetical protein
MSREEADAEDTKKKSDDMRLTLAIQKSKEEVFNSLIDFLPPPLFLHPLNYSNPDQDRREDKCSE